MKFLKLLQEFSGLLLIALLILIAFCAIWQLDPENKEIDNDEYVEISKKLESHPELKPHVQESLSDGKITRRERMRLFPESRVAPRSEVERLKDILRKE